MSIYVFVAVFAILLCRTFHLFANFSAHTNMKRPSSPSRRLRNKIRGRARAQNWKLALGASAASFAKHGSKWAQMTRYLPGRTDNGIKNRYHYLRRRFEKRIQSVGDSKELDRMTKQIEDNPSFRSLSCDPHVARDIASRILYESTDLDLIVGDAEHKLGPFHQVEESVLCKRCGLIAPSKETGRFV